MIYIRITAQVDEKDVGKLITAAVRRGKNYDNVNKPVILMKRLLQDYLQDKINTILKEE